MPTCSPTSGFETIIPVSDQRFSCVETASFRRQLLDNLRRRELNKIQGTEINHKSSERGVVAWHKDAQRGTLGRSDCPVSQRVLELTEECMNVVRSKVREVKPSTKEVRTDEILIFNSDIRQRNGERAVVFAVATVLMRRPPSSSLSYGPGNDDVRSPGSGGTPGPLSQPPGSQQSVDTDPGSVLPPPNDLVKEVLYEEKSSN
ncbi:hypothetical protein RUM43_007208 [Polyplax serrata]|uniref:Uncharacterized protein n=1 Tax=Polyplax serrata TaxID=468196 RepID=A0AAN8Q5S7_POLSC